MGKLRTEVENEERRTANNESSNKERLMDKAEEIKKATDDLSQLQVEKESL